MPRKGQRQGQGVLLRLSMSMCMSMCMPMLLISILLTSSVSATKHVFTTRRDHRTFIGPIGAPFGFLKDGEYILSVSDFKVAIRDHHRRYGHKNNNHNNNISKKTKAEQLKEEEQIEKELLKQLHPGFLLKRFENENDFANFQETIYDNVTYCGFGDFIQGGLFAEDDDNYIGIPREGPRNSPYDDESLASSTMNQNPLMAGKKKHGGEEDDDDYAYGEGDGLDDDLTMTSYYDLYHDKKLATGDGVIDGGGEAGIFLSMKNQQHMWTPNTPKLEHSFTVAEKGFYFLFYQICLTPQQSSDSNSKNDDLSKFIFKEITSNFEIDFHYKNIDGLGKVSYLTAGEMPLPHMFMYFTVSYIILLIMWLQNMKGDMNISNPNGVGGGGPRPKPTIYAIHHLMSAVVFLKILSMLFESIRYHFIRVNGQADLWSFMYYVINFVKGTSLFTVILLIGSGWSFFKSYLTTKERRIILFVILLQIVDNVAITILTHGAENEQLYNEWSTILHFVDIVSCCAVLLPIVWQVNTLEESVEAGNLSATDEDEDEVERMNGGRAEDVEEPSSSSSSSSQPSSRLKSKLYLFRSFYLIVVAYIYFTRIVIYLFASSLKYNQTWIRYFVYELGTLTFYFCVGMKLRPVAEVHSYAHVRSGGNNGDDANLDDSKSGNVELSVVGIMNGQGKIAKD